MKTILPNYQNCQTNLICSVLKYFGAEYTHPTLPNVDKILAQIQYKNVVVMLFDGLGSRILAQHLPEDSYLRQHQISEMTSVFPATTTATTSSIRSGLNPVEHGWLGWNMYVPDIDKTVTSFLNVLKDTEKSVADYPVMERFFPFQTASDKIHAAGYISHEVSPYGETYYDKDTPQAMYDKIYDLCQKEGKKYIYAYCTNPDTLMHELGTKHADVHQTIQFINDQVKDLRQRLSPDTLIIITADHGHIDSHYKFLSDYPQLQATLLRETSIELRAVNFFTKPGLKKDFEKEFNKHFADDFWLLKKDEVIAKQLFGDGTENPRFRATLGDYLAIATADVCLVDDRRHPILKSNHAGMTEAEMLVPLIVLQ